jgi:hypothetical protein
MSDPLDILSTSPAAASHDAGAHDTVNLDASTGTFPSDSENYSPSTNASPSPPSSSSPLILYSPPTLWGLLRGAAINLILPFVNGLMLGFGELVANEAAYRLGWSGTKVRLNISFGEAGVDGNGMDRTGIFNMDWTDQSAIDLPHPERREQARRAGRRDAGGPHREAEEERAGAGYVHCAGVGLLPQPTTMERWSAWSLFIPSHCIGGFASRFSKMLVSAPEEKERRMVTHHEELYSKEIYKYLH